MRTLVIDEGNTKTKYGIFEDETLSSVGFISSQSELNPLLESENPTVGVISSVKAERDSLFQNQNSFGFPILHISKDSPMPIKVDYHTPETLGVDRLVAAVGAFAEFPNDNFLVVDLGTCITADLLVDGTFLGGWIIPGFQIQLDAMHEKTGKLPQLKAQFNTDEGLFGKTTSSSMKSGVRNSVIMALKGFFKQAEIDFGKLSMIVTGGDVNQLETNLKDSIFVRPNLNLTGLHRILKFNEEVGT